MRWNVYMMTWIALAAGMCASTAAPAITNMPAESVFIMPTSPEEGRDPFFPNSTRPYDAFIAKRAVDVTSLEIKGFSEINGRRYVIINNHTFAAGDQGDVTTPQGRIHVRCLNVGTNSVLVESGGVRHVLKFSDGP